MKAHRVVRRRGSYIFLVNRLTDGGEVVSLTRRPSFAPRKIPGRRMGRTDLVRAQWRALVNEINEPSGCIKGSEIFGRLSDWRLFNKVSVPWS
jgi:hypothetical protein